MLLSSVSFRTNASRYVVSRELVVVVAVSGRGQLSLGTPRVYTHWAPLTLWQNRELQIMRIVRHPNIVELKAFYYSNGDRVSRFFSMFFLAFRLMLRVDGVMS